MNFAAEALQRGEIVEGYKESGNSMKPRIHHRQPITLAPAQVDKIEEGDIVMVKVKGRIFTHLVKATNVDQVLIGNNHGHINGWAARRNIYGIVTHVDGVEIKSSRDKIRSSNE